MRTEDVIVVGVDDDKVQVEVSSVETPPLSSKVESEDIPQDSELASEAPQKKYVNQGAEEVVLAQGEGQVSRGQGIRRSKRKF